jgi:hypothetical protein
MPNDDYEWLSKPRECPYCGDRVRMAHIRGSNDYVCVSGSILAPVRHSCSEPISSRVFVYKNGQIMRVVEA